MAKDDVTITLRVSEEEKGQIIKIAKSKKVKPAQYVRGILLERLKADEILDDSGLTIATALQLAMEGKLTAHMEKANGQTKVNAGQGTPKKPEGKDEEQEKTEGQEGTEATEPKADAVQV